LLHLYEGFINAVEGVLPNAKVVADRFHVTNLYRAAVGKLRTIEMKEIKQVLKKEEYSGLKGVLWDLRKKSEDLEPEEREMLDGDTRRPQKRPTVNSIGLISEENGGTSCLITWVGSGDVFNKYLFLSEQSFSTNIVIQALSNKAV